MALAVGPVVRGALNAELAPLQSVQDLRPGEWEVQDSGPRVCTLPSGERGADSSYLRMMSPGVADADQPAMAAAVEDLWQAAGYDATTPYREPINDLLAVEVGYPASGTIADGFRLQFSTTTQGSVVSGRPGAGWGTPGR